MLFTKLLFILLLTLTTSLFANASKSCYSVQILSSKKYIPYSTNFPKGSRLFHIGNHYTIRNGCYNTVKDLKKHLAELTKGYSGAIIVSTYRYRFAKKQKETKQKRSKQKLSFCISSTCKHKHIDFSWEKVNTQKAEHLIHVGDIQTIVPFNFKLQKQIKQQENNNSIPDEYRFYFNPYLSDYSGQTPIKGEKLYGNTEKLTLGVQYLHFFNNFWHFYTDIRIIPYRTQNNQYTKTDISLDVKEFYIKSDQLWNNQANFLIGRKVLQDQRSWYYHSALDTIGVFNKHDLLLYEIYGGTRLTSNIVVDGTTTSQYDLKNTKFLIGHVSYEYFIANTIELFGQYEKTNNVNNRNLHWIGFRAKGNLMATRAKNFSYWFDLAKVDGSIKNKTQVKAQKVTGLGVDMGLIYHFNTNKDGLALSYAYGSGGTNLYVQSHLTNNRSDFLAKYLSFRYYGSFLDPELSNIRISSLYYSHILKNENYAFILALHNYRQNVASKSQYIATSYTVSPNGLSSDLGNEMDCILGAYFQQKYNWHFVLSYFMGGNAYNDAASNKDGFYGQINFRYYWH